MTESKPKTAEEIAADLVGYLAPRMQEQHADIAFNFSKKQIAQALLSQRQLGYQEGLEKADNLMMETADRFEKAGQVSTAAIYLSAAQIIHAAKQGEKA